MSVVRPGGGGHAADVGSHHAGPGGGGPASPPGTPAGSGALGEGIDPALAARRRRMVLGRYAEPVLPRDPADIGLDDTLGYLYDREYTGRGHVLGGPDPSGPGGGGGSTAPAACSPSPPWSAWSVTP